MKLPLDHIEKTIVDDIATIITKAAYSTKNHQWIISDSAVAEMEKDLGTRLTRLALRKANFEPITGEEGWQSVSKWPHNDRREVPALDIGEMLDALYDLDPKDELQKALGL